MLVRYSRTLNFDIVTWLNDARVWSHAVPGGISICRGMESEPCTYCFGAVVLTWSAVRIGLANRGDFKYLECDRR